MNERRFTNDDLDNLNQAGVPHRVTTTALILDRPGYLSRLISGTDPALARTVAFYDGHTNTDPFLVKVVLVHPEIDVRLAFQTALYVECSGALDVTVVTD